MEKEIIIDNKCGGIINTVRMMMNCSQAEFGKKIGLDQPSVCRIERRQVMPNEAVLERIAHLAGVSVYQLTGQEPIDYSRI